MPNYDQSRIRNFCIIAHIDHGKSTLADRILERTGVMQLRDMTDQVLDSMELERERGITIKSKAVRMTYTARDGQVYELNLIDTPGHVDFTYEVSRALAACEGAVLVVDASQGIEAQTLANVYMALEHDLEILPVINKIDLPSADPDGVRQQIEDEIGLDAEGCPLISAKQGVGIDDVLEDIVAKVPAPQDDPDAPLQALIFDSYYDNYRGAISSVRLKGGSVRVGDRIRMMSSGREFDVTEVGAYLPLGYAPKEALRAGEVGYIAASIKDIADIHVGDTITRADKPAAAPLPGYKPVLPMVYCGIYPADGGDYEGLRDALEKLRLNDAALSFEPETSVALGYGFRCGFLGLLHMEIIQERLEREFDLDLVTTAPSVVYRVVKTDGSVVSIDNPTNLPPVQEISWMEEPFVDAQVITPQEYVGAIMELCQDKRGTFRDMKYIDGGRVVLSYDLPLNEVIYDFFDQLKSRTRAMRRSTTSSKAMCAAIWSSWTCCSTGSSATRCRSSCTRIALMRAGARLPKSSRMPYRGSCLRFPFRRRSAARSSRARRSRRCARTCSPSAMAATSRARRSCWRSRRRARSACVRWAAFRCPARRSWRF